MHLFATLPLCFLALLTSGQESQRARAESGSARTPRFFIDAGRYTISELVSRSSEYLGRTYLIDTRQDPQAEVSTVNVERRLELDAAGCEDVVSQLAYTLYWVMTPLDANRGIYQWIYLPGPHRMEIMKRGPYVPWEQVVARPSLVGYVRTIYPLAHLDPAKATNTLRPLFQQQDQTGMDSMSTLGNTSSVVLCGWRGTVVEMIRLLEKADQPPAKIEPTLAEWMQKLDERLSALEAAFKKK